MDETQANEHFNFIVHNFTSTSSLPSTPAMIIDAGRNAIDRACRSDGWSSVDWDFDTSVYNSRGNAYNFSRPPPIRYSREGNAAPFMHPLKEWGIPADDAEDPIAVAENILEFESTDFNYLLSITSGHARPQSTHGGHAGTDNFLPPVNNNNGPQIDRWGPPPKKRRRLDKELLHNIIPQPHFRGSSFSTYPPLDTRLITAYIKSQPIPIPTYDSSTVQEYLNAPYARSAWIIPIRGDLPWEGSTSAIVLEGSTIRPSGPRPNLSTAERKSCIMWTHSSVISFWDFLLAVQNARTLGPISISFHAAPAHISPAFATSDDVVAVTVETNHQPLAEDVAAKSSVHNAAPMSLQSVDHIKVYHDVMYAMYLRNALDAWGYHLPTRNVGPQVPYSEDSAGNGKRNSDERCRERKVIPPPAADVESKKIRILKGAKLVLVDHSSKAMLLS